MKNTKKIKPNALLKVPIQVDCETGRTIKTLGEVLEFKKGTVLKLEDSTKNVIQVYANGKKIANGKTVRKDGEIFVKVTEALTKKGVN